MRNIGRCVGKFGWQDISGGVIRELSEADRERYVAKCCLEECKE